jgi:hypothetical protein
MTNWIDVEQCTAVFGENPFIPKCNDDIRFKKENSGKDKSFCSSLPALSTICLGKRGANQTEPPDLVALGTAATEAHAGQVGEKVAF